MFIQAEEAHFVDKSEPVQLHGLVWENMCGVFESGIYPKMEFQWETCLDLGVP